MKDAMVDPHFRQFQHEMIAEAKEIQGENYAGDEYYLQEECWLEVWEPGASARDAVLMDMSYWDA